jgi:hypothetical protein
MFLVRGPFKREGVVLFLDGVTLSKAEGFTFSFGFEIG